MKKNNATTTATSTTLAVKTTGNVKATQPKKTNKKVILNLPEVVETPKATPIILNKKEVVASNMTGKGLARKIAADKAKAAKKPAKKAAAPKPEIIKVTMLEHAVLMGLIGSLYAEEGFSDVECADLAKTCKLSVKSVKGVVGSLVSKGLVTTAPHQSNGSAPMEFIYLSKKALCLHPEYSKEATEWIELEIVDAKSKTVTNTTVNIKNAIIVAAPAGSSRKPQSTKPYGKYGLHGHNIDVKGLVKGDKVSFDIKKQTVIGEFVHVHVNNHSPKGYAVIKYSGKIYERVLDKVNKVIAPKALPVSTSSPLLEMAIEAASEGATKVRTLPAKAQKAVNNVAKKAATTAKK